MHFRSDFLAHFPNTPNKRRGDMTKAQWLWEVGWTQEQREKAVKALKMYAAWAKSVPPEALRFEPSPCKFMEALELMDFEPDPQWMFEVRSEWRNEVQGGEIVGVQVWWRKVADKWQGPFKTRAEAQGG